MDFVVKCDISAKNTAKYMLYELFYRQAGARTHDLPHTQTS